MKNITKKLSIILIFVFGFGLTINSISAEPILNSVTVIPENPEPMSEVTVIADIEGDNIESITLSVSECFDDGGNDPSPTCYNNTQADMALNSDNKYETSFTLKDTKGITDHIEMLFLVSDEDQQYQLEGGKAYYASQSNDNGNENPNNGDNNTDTPGFELIFLIGAIFIALIFYNKKR